MTIDSLLTSTAFTAGATPFNTAGADRRRHRRFPIGVPVRLRAEGTRSSMMIELSDVSFRGCRLGMLSTAQPPELDTLIAFGFVLPGRKIALVKGRVVRHIDDPQGSSIGIAIDRANVTFYEFLMSLAEGEASYTPAPAFAAAS